MIEQSGSAMQDVALARAQRLAETLTKDRLEEETKAAEQLVK
jgi:hypothetical protein